MLLLLGVGLDDQHAPLAAGNEIAQLVEHAVEHVAALDRLGQEGDRARGERPAAGLVGRDHADRHVPRRQVVLQPLQHAPAVDVGQEDVERDRRRACTRGPRRSAAAPSDVTSPLKPLLAGRVEQEPGKADVVLDDQQHAIAGPNVVAVVVRPR